MADRTVDLGADAEAGRASRATRRWNSRPTSRRTEAGAADGGSSAAATGRVPQPSRSQGRDWGVVLAILGSAAFLVAAGVTYAVMRGGLFGLMTARDAMALTAALVALGGVVLYRGWRAYRGS